MTAEPIDALGAVLGLSRTEAHIYWYLLGREDAPGRQIAEECNISRGKIYALLRALENVGLVERIPSRPSRFKASDPFETLAKAQRRFRALGRQAAILRKEVSQRSRSTTRDISVQMPVVLRGRRAVSRRLQTAIESAHEALILLTSDACLRRNHPWLIPLLRRRARELKSLRVLVPSSRHSVSLVQPIRGDAMVRQSPRDNEGLTLCLVDNSSFVICRWIPDDLSYRNESDYCILIKDEVVVSRGAEMMEGSWKDAIEIRLSTHRQRTTETR